MLCNVWQGATGLDLVQLLTPTHWPLTTAQLTQVASSVVFTYV